MPELDAEHRDQMAEALCRWWDDEDGGGDPGHADVETPCAHCRMETDALAPLVAGWLADAWDKGCEDYRHRLYAARNPYRGGDDG